MRVREIHIVYVVLLAFLGGCIYNFYTMERLEDLAGTFAMFIIVITLLFGLFKDLK